MAKTLPSQRTPRVRQTSAGPAPRLLARHRPSGLGRCRVRHTACFRSTRRASEERSQSVLGVLRRLGDRPVHLQSRVRRSGLTQTKRAHPAGGRSGCDSFGPTICCPSHRVVIWSYDIRIVPGMEARAAHYRSRPDLTSRQRHILKLMAEGSTNAEIGQKLGITLDGAKWHVSEIIHKLDATSREDAVVRWKASQSGLERAGRAARAMVGLLKVPSAYLAAGAVATACVVAVSAALTSFEARDTGPRLATSGSVGVGISLPT